MGLPEPTLVLFKYNRADPMYLKMKMEQFERGFKCICGQLITTKNAMIKNVCECKEALKNHVTFPTYSALRKRNGDIYDNQEVTVSPSHWILLAEVHLIQKTKGMPVYVLAFTPQNEYVTIELDKVYNLLLLGDSTFRFSDLEMGHTIALLYAQVDEENGLLLFFLSNKR